MYNVGIMKFRVYTKGKPSKPVEVMSIKEFNKAFPDEDAAIQYIENAMWGNKPICPHCGGKKSYSINDRPGYRCGSKGCRKNFTYKTNTIFHGSKASAIDWLMAIRLFLQNRKGLSSIILAIELGVTQKTSTYILQRLRLACEMKSESDWGKTAGIVEVDEAYFGGKEGNKHADKKSHSGRGGVGKTILAAAVSRDRDNIRMEVLQNTDKESLHKFVTENVEKGSKINTDEARGYIGLGESYDHQTVNHSQGQYVVGESHVNGAESVWSVLKRGEYGVFHQISAEHLSSYASEFGFRLTKGSCQIDIGDRMESLIRNGVRKRTTRDIMNAMGPYANNPKYKNARKIKSKKQKTFKAKQARA